MFVTPAFAQATGSGGFGSTIGSLVPYYVFYNNQTPTKKSERT